MYPEGHKCHCAFVAFTLKGINTCCNGSDRLKPCSLGQDILLITHFQICNARRYTADRERLWAFVIICTASFKLNFPDFSYAISNSFISVSDIPGASSAPEIISTDSPFVFLSIKEDRIALM